MTGSDPIVLQSVEKNYGGLRPLRIKELRVGQGEFVSLVGFDRPAAETFVNLVTGATLPDRGEVVVLGKHTQDIVNSDEWLGFVERFGIVSGRIVLLEAMTVSQNLALSFDLAIDPIPPEVLTKVRRLADEVEIDELDLLKPAAETTPLTRSRLLLARALALDPQVLVLEHPSAAIEGDERGRLSHTIKTLCRSRRLTTLCLTADEPFAKETGGRLLVWQPATGEFRQRSSLRFW